MAMPDPLAYHIEVLGRTNSEAIAKVAAALDKIVAAKPKHGRDHAHILAAATAMINLLPEPDTEDVAVLVGGTIAFADDTPGAVQRIHLAIGAQRVLREVATAAPNTP